MAKNEDSKLIRDLRKQIIKLRRENAQLKKRNSRIENDFLEIQSAVVDDEPQEEVPVKTKKIRNTCPECGSFGIMEFQIRDTPYYRCLDCKCKGKFPK
jgi:DNA-directed RNA polymerase subunit M/transcription elongation factor TFIIS